MTSENSKTVDSYEKKIDTYVATTPTEVDGTMKTWMDDFTKGVRPEGTVFEIGSGTGRDADYFTKTHSLNVVCSDAPSGFVDLLTSKGYPAFRFDVLKDEFPVPSADAVFSNAVLHHFTREDAQFIMRKIYKFTAGNAPFAFSVKSGEGEEWTSEKIGEPRFFTYWSMPEIFKLVISAGFKEVEVSQSPGWLFIIAK